MIPLLVEHQCPQCGAPALLEETDRIFHCDYCRVKSYLLQKDYFRYMLPHSAPEGVPLVYFPYWRCRGMLFSCVSNTIHQRVVDHSRPAIPAAHFPESLGLRTQAMTLKLAVDHEDARFLQPSVEMQNAVLEFKNYFRSAMSEHVHVQALIGETLSMIYAPFYLDDTLKDAVLNRTVAPAPQAAGDIADIPAAAADWPVRFIPTLCPNCGWDMAAEKDALSLACPRCRSMWRAGKGGLKRMKCRTLPDTETPSEGRLYLPFWRITASVPGIDLSSYADFAKQANLPKVVQDSWKGIPFHFWAPAMKLSPQAFLRAGCAMTLAQPGEAPVGDIPNGRFYPVKLPFTEAVSALKIIMASLLRPKNRILPQLENMTISAKDVVLVYVPFRETAHEYMHSRYHLCINKNMLRLTQRVSS